MMTSVPGWTAGIRFDQGIQHTVDHILAHPELQVPDPDFAAVLNALSDLFGLGNIDLNQVPRALNFISCVGKKGGKGYELVPSVDRIKTHITKESYKS